MKFPVAILTPFPSSRHLTQRNFKGLLIGFTSLNCMTSKLYFPTQQLAFYDYGIPLYSTISWLRNLATIQRFDVGWHPAEKLYQTFFNGKELR